MKYKIRNANVCASGGGCYLFTGELTNGKFFLADNTYFDVIIINRNPNNYDYDEIWMSDWQKECTQDILDAKERILFFEDLLNFYKQNNIKDYILYNMIWIESELNKENKICN